MSNLGGQLKQGATLNLRAEKRGDDPGSESLIYDPSTVEWAVAEVVAQPPAALSRWALYLTTGILVVVVCFAAFSTVPTTVSGRGSIRSSEKPRALSVEVGGRIAELKTELGAHVKTGDVLIEMAQLLSSEDAARAQALIKDARSILTSGGTKSTLAKVDAFLAEAQLSGDYLGNEQAGLQTSGKALQQALVRLHNTLPQTLQSARLERSQAVAKIKKISALRAQREFAVDLEQLQATVARLDSQVRQSDADARGQVASALTGFQTAADAFARAAKSQAEVQRVVAPIDGTVLEITTAGKGELVAPGQKLLTLVPRAGVLIADIELSNTDIPGVREGLPARLKLDALPFQDWGVVDGAVRTVATDARTVEGGQAPTYNVTLRLDKFELTSGSGHTEPLRLGMALTAEIRTREQSLLRLVLMEILKLRSLFE